MIRVQIFAAALGAIHSFGIGYLYHPASGIATTTASVAVAFASAFSWAIGSVAGAPSWWNGNTNIIAAWLAATAAALMIPI